jgi:hypothetical protein
MSKEIKADDVFAFLSTSTGYKQTYGEEPFTNKRTVVSDVGLTDRVSHESIEKGNYATEGGNPCITTRQVCNVMLPLLRKTEPHLPRTGIFLDEEDMKLFELDADGTPAKEEPVGRNVLNALSLGNLYFGMILFSRDEILFQLHPNKNAWKLKGQEMYGFETAGVFDEAFSLSCAMPSCRYFSYFPQVGLAAPAVLPMFIRKGLINRVPQYIRLLSVFVKFKQQGAYPLMCLPCLLMKQIHNRFTERLSFDPSRPQLSPFTVVDLEKDFQSEERDDKSDSITGTTSSSSFTTRYIERCKKGVGCQSDLYEDNDHSYYMTRLPFGDIEIANDYHGKYNGGYTVQWRDGI